MVRRLSDEEHRLWVAAMKSVRPLRGRRAGNPPAAVPADAGQAPAPVAPGSAVALVPRPPQRSAWPPLLAPLARRETQRLSRGRTDIDARLDLHGMTQAEAHAALLSFLLRAQAQDARFVLVITGKGGDGISRGVLRRQVPLWFQLPEFRTCVAGFDAAVGHGGAGALYVRIRRRRC